MNRETKTIRQRNLGITVMVSLGLLLAACSSNSTASITTSQTSTFPPASTTPAITTPGSPSSEPSLSSPTAGGGLSGKWSGQYSGAFQGTFTLNWTQSESKLTGTIRLSSFNGTLPINGTVSGNAIHFGTVGSTDITYSGSVSGDSMSGTYQLHTPNGAEGGPWNATRSS
jgi:hypothetical protein